MPTPTGNIDLMDLRNRILAVKNGTLPPDAYSDDELRQALAQLRSARSAKASAPASTRSVKTSAAPLPLAGGTPGGLLDLLSKSDE